MMKVIRVNKLKAKFNVNVVRWSLTASVDIILYFKNMEKLNKRRWVILTTLIIFVAIIRIGCSRAPRLPQFLNLTPTNNNFSNPPVNQQPRETDRSSQVQENTATPGLPTLMPSPPKTPTSVEHKGMTRSQADQLLPVYPAQVAAEIDGHVITVRWPSTGKDVVNYTIYRKTIDDEEWQQLTHVLVSGDNLGWFAWNDTTANQGIAYLYGVSATNYYNRESAITKSNTITLP